MLFVISKQEEKVNMKVKLLKIYLLLIIVCIIPLQVSAATLEIDDWGDTEVEVSKELLKNEKSYRKKAIKEFNNKAIANNETQIIFQAFNENPQSIFMFDYKDKKIVGKKYISDAVVYKNLPGLFCSNIQAPMLLGIFEKEQITQDGIIVYFKPFSFNEKKLIFSKLLEDRKIDIYYPYTQLLSEKKLEKTSPKDGWKFDQERSESLGLGEEELRKYTIKFLGTFSSLSKKRVFDPACSTGQFLSTLKKYYPNIYTIGQDLSPSMIKMAKYKIDKAYVGDSINSPVSNSSVDFIFFRFLNGEVVTTEQAYNLFNSLIKKVKQGGYIIVFGHSPVLISKQVMENIGLELIQANGVSEDKKSVFQYYILKKVKPVQNFNYKSLISNKNLYH
jgi:isonocardicin synthase